VSQTHSGDFIVGKVGKDLTAEEGAKAAQCIALSLLATLKGESEMYFPGEFSTGSLTVLHRGCWDMIQPSSAVLTTSSASSS
jgi:hypothetical protein